MLYRFVSPLIFLLCLFALASPATASLFDWSSPGVISVGGLEDVSPPDDGADIVRVRYGADAGYRYFRMELEGPVPPDWGYNLSYNIYFGTTAAPPTFDSYSALLGTTYYEFNPLSQSYTVSHFAPGTSLAVNAPLGESFLEWRIDREALSDSFSFFGATLYEDYSEVANGQMRNYVDRTPIAATPVPPALFLLASGLATLAGLRKKFR